MPASIEQKLATLEGLQKQIDKYLADLDDNDLHYTMHRVKQEILELSATVTKLRQTMNALAHAVAVSTDEESINPYVEEIYRHWEQGLKKGMYGDNL